MEDNLVGSYRAGATCPPTIRVQVALKNGKAVSALGPVGQYSMTEGIKRVKFRLPVYK